MPKKGKSKRLLFEEYVEQTNPPVIAEAEWREIRDRLAPISDGYLRQLLRDSGRPLAPLVEGVRQDSLEHLERSLIGLAEVYSASTAKGDAATARQCRRIVIEAKDHARWAARSARTAPEKKAEKGEMISWMLIWLENPGIFPAWARLRSARQHVP